MKNNFDNFKKKGLGNTNKNLIVGCSLLNCDSAILKSLARLSNYCGEHSLVLFSLCQDKGMFCKLVK